MSEFTFQVGKRVVTISSDMPQSALDQIGAWLHVSSSLLYQTEAHLATAQAALGEMRADRDRLKDELGAERQEKARLQEELVRATSAKNVAQQEVAKLKELVAENEWKRRLTLSRIEAELGDLLEEAGISKRFRPVIEKCVEKILKLMEDSNT